MAKILKTFEFREDRRRRVQQEKEKRRQQEAESAQQEAEFVKEQERLEELSKAKAKTLSEEYDMPDYTP
jgi:hypothetical protein